LSSFISSNGSKGKQRPFLPFQTPLHAPPFLRIQKRFLTVVPPDKKNPDSSQTPTEAAEKENNPTGSSKRKEVKFLGEEKPFAEKTLLEIESWFLNARDKEFAEYIPLFKSYTGKSLANLSKETLQDEVKSKGRGEALYNAIQEEHKKPQEGKLLFSSAALLLLVLSLIYSFFSKPFKRALCFKLPNKL